MEKRPCWSCTLCRCDCSRPERNASVAIHSDSQRSCFVGLYPDTCRDDLYWRHDRSHNTESSSRTKERDAGQPASRLVLALMCRRCDESGMASVSRSQTAAKRSV